MTELLNKAIEAAQKLSPEEQDALARELLERLTADARWDTLFADPRSEDLLNRLADEADAEIAAGDACNFDPANRPER